MSQQGIHKVAGLLSVMQQMRVDLFGGDRQDILLGRLLEKMNDAVKDEFCEITLMNNREIESRRK